MAPVKPMGINAPKTKPGVTGFVQEYNQEAPKTSDLNPDVVTEDSVLPPVSTQLPADKPRRGPKNGRRSKK